MQQHVDILVKLLVWGCAIPANGYVLLYMFRPWRSTEPGRALMTKAVANAILIDLGLSVVVFGENYALRPYVRATGFLLFGAGVWYLFIALIRSDRQRREFPPLTWIDAVRRRFSRARRDDDLPPTHTRGGVR